MTIAWASVPGAVAYDVEWRKDSGNWIKVQRTGATGVDVTGIYAGAYLARVRAISAFEISSIWKSSQLTQLNGKEGLPPAISYLTAESRLFEIGLKWGFPEGSEDTQRTEIWFSKSNSLASAAKLSDLAFPQNDYGLQSLAAGAKFFFWARLVDRSGNIGPFYPAQNGVVGQASAEAGPILEMIAGQIGETELGKELLGRIDLIDGSGPGSVNDRLEAAKKELEGLIGEITDALEYDNTRAYAVGEIARLGNRLFQAIAATTGHAPPNASYWLDMGTLAETTNALALQVQKNSASIIEQDGKITAQAEQLSAINTKVIDPVTGLEATASGLNSLVSTVETLDGKVAAQVSSLQALQASYRDDNGEGDLAGALEGYSSAASFVQEVKVRSSQNAALSQRQTEFSAEVGEVKGTITELEQVVATDREVTAQAIQQIGVEIGDNSSAIQTVSKAQADTDGKLSTMWSVKMQVNANGQLVTAGIGLGIETNAEGVTQSQFLVAADRFAIVGTTAGGQVFTPFAVHNGQAFIDSAFIRDGTIDNAKIGSFISSIDYVEGVSGWRLDKSGTFEINGNVPGQGRMVMTHRSLRVYDAANKKRVQLGDLTE